MGSIFVKAPTVHRGTLGQKTATCPIGGKWGAFFPLPPWRSICIPSIHPHPVQMPARQGLGLGGCESRAWCQIQYVCKHWGMPKPSNSSQKWSHLYEGKACSTSFSTLNSVFGRTQCIYGLVYTCWYLILSSYTKKKQPCNLLRAVSWSDLTAVFIEVETTCGCPRFETLTYPHPIKRHVWRWWFSELPFRWHMLVPWRVYLYTFIHKMYMIIGELQETITSKRLCEKKVPN